jgi:hypothetical protein
MIGERKGSPELPVNVSDRLNAENLESAQECGLRDGVGNGSADRRVAVALTIPNYPLTL